MSRKLFAVSRVVSLIVTFVLAEYAQLCLTVDGENGMTPERPSSVASTIAPVAVTSLPRTTTAPPVAGGKSFAKNGDFYFGGLFDIYTEEDGVCTGAINPRGLQWMYAMVYAVKLLNERTDFLPNISLGFHIKDSCANSLVAVTSSLDFITSSSLLDPCGNSSINDGQGSIVAVVGPATSVAATSVASLFALFQLPEISYSATGDQLSFSRYRYFTRVVPRDRAQATGLADIVSRYGWSVVVALSSDDQAYGVSGLDQFVEVATDRGICIAYRTRIGSSTSEEELYHIVNRIREFKNIKVIVAFSSESPMLRLLGAFADLNATGYTWVGSDAWVTSPVLTADARISTVTRGMLGLRFASKRVDGFIDYLKKVSPATTDYKDPFLIDYWEKTFGCYLTDDRQDVYVDKCSGEEVLPSSDVLLAGGFVSTIVDATEVVARALQKTLVCDEKYCHKNMVHGATILKFMKNVSFDGTSGYRIELDEGGDLASSAIYDLFNIKPKDLCSNDTILRRIGSWNVEDGFSFTEEVAWASQAPCMLLENPPTSFCSHPCSPGKRLLEDGVTPCCWSCVQCPKDQYSDDANALKCLNCPGETVASANQTACVVLPPSYLTPSTSLGIVLMTLSTPGIALVIAFTAVYVFKRNTRVVVYTCSGYGHAIMASSMLCFIVTWLLLIPASDPSCLVNACLTLLPVAMLQGFLVQTAYITKKGRGCVGDNARVVMTIGVLFVYAVFTAVWFATDLPSSSRTIDPIANVVHVSCRSGQLFAVALPLAYSLLLDTLGLCTAYKARRHETNLSEGKFIFFAFAVHIMVWSATVAVYLAIEDSGHGRTVILAMGVTFTGYIPLVLIFVPKLYAMKSKPRVCKKVDTKMRRRITGRRKAINRRYSIRQEFVARHELLRNYRKTLDLIHQERAHSDEVVKLCRQRKDELMNK